MRRAHFYLLVSAFILIVLYLPYLLHGGFVIDDWGVVTAAATHNGLLDTYKSWFPLFSNRPLAPILITLTGTLFGAHPFGYIVVNLALFLAALSLTGAVLERYIGRRFSFLAILLAATPIIASTLIFSPGMQITATASYALWALSLWCLSRYLQNGSRWHYFTAYFLILTCLLTYEIILPLLVITLCLPWIAGKRVAPIRYLLLYALPLAVVVGLDLVYQKGVMPHFMTVYSRFKPVKAHDILHVGKIWTETLAINTPSLWAKGVRFGANGGTSAVNTAVIAAGWVIAVITAFRLPAEAAKRNWRVGIILFVSFGSSLTLYLLTNTIPITHGYDNRGLSATWLTAALFVAYLGSIPRRRLLTGLALIVVGLSWLSFAAERTTYIASYKAQITMVNDCIAAAHRAHVPAGATIIGDVPHQLPGSFNYEDVFNDPWNFGGALALYSHNYISGGTTYTYEKQVNGLIKIDDDQLVVDAYWPANYQNLWLYTYNYNTKRSTIERVTSADQLTELTKHLVRYP